LSVLEAAILHPQFVPVGSFLEKSIFAVNILLLWQVVKRRLRPVSG
jgi:hypothetical protein